MTKFIISTLGQAIRFNLSSTRKLVIDTTPVSVTEDELVILEKRLGAQIKVVDTPTEKETPTEEVAPLKEKKSKKTEVVAEEDTTVKTEAPTEGSTEKVD